MNANVRQGLFEAIDSFAIRRRNEFYLIGRLKEGTVQERWFLNVPLNKSIAITIRIKSIEDVEFANDQNKYMLLIVAVDNEDINLLLGLNIGSELLDITIEGED